MQGAQPVHADSSLRVLGVHLVGVNGENGKRLLFTLIALVVVWGVGVGLRALARLILHDREDIRGRFYSQQAVQIVTGILLVLALASIWFNNPGQLGNVVAFVAAGLAIALQKVVTAIAGYLVILRGRLFEVGDRITLGGVRGDVIQLGWIRTTVMGQPPAVKEATPAMWVEGRQYTGRIVTITNDKVFDEPVYNYTREFPYLWEEMHVPITYEADRKRAEAILLEVARRHATPLARLSADELKEMQRRYFIEATDLEPRVYLRLTDNWVELALRFVCGTHGIRELKNRMSREILDLLDAAKIGVASGTYAVVAMPTLQVKLEGSAGASPSR